MKIKIFTFIKIKNYYTKNIKRKTAKSFSKREVDGLLSSRVGDETKQFIFN